MTLQESFKQMTTEEAYAKFEKQYFELQEACQQLEILKKECNDKDKTIRNLKVVQATLCEYILDYADDQIVI